MNIHTLYIYIPCTPIVKPTSNKVNLMKQDFTQLSWFWMTEKYSTVRAPLQYSEPPSYICHKSVFPFFYSSIPPLLSEVMPQDHSYINALCYRVILSSPGPVNHCQRYNYAPQWAKRKNIPLKIAVYTVYILGILWQCSHSIFTAENKKNRPIVEENADLSCSRVLSDIYKQYRN